MFGFISVLSASLAIYMIVFISILVGYIHGSIPVSSKVKMAGLNFEYTISSYMITENQMIDISANLQLKNADKYYVSSSCNYGSDSRVSKPTPASTALFVVTENLVSRKGAENNIKHDVQIPKIDVTNAYDIAPNEVEIASNKEDIRVEKSPLPVSIAWAILDIISTSPKKVPIKPKDTVNEAQRITCLLNIYEH